jgi:tetratricopeptide (TPR) repeat protein
VVQGMLDDLRLERARLNRLKRDSASVRASFNLSYDRLPTALQQQFAALGVFGGADFSAEAIAFIWNVPIETALADLRTLIARSLLQPSQEGRFRMHPLVRDFARERLGEWSDYHEGVVRRSTDYFAAFVRDHARDFTALDVEIDNALYALRVADEQARDARFLDFARNLYPYFETRGMFDQASQVYQRSREIASQEKDVAALANALYMLASIRLRLAEYDRVIDLCQQGLQVLHEVDRQPLSVKLYRTIGSAYYGRGDFRNSAHYTEQGLIIARDIGDIGQVGDISAGLGMMLFELGQVEEGKARLLEGKQACLQIGNIASASVGCINLSESAMEMGDLANALMYAEEGEALARRIGHRERLANVLADLGDAKSALGCYDEAEDHFQESIALAEPLPWMRGFVLIPYARHLLRTGRIAQAEATAQRSLAEGQRIASNEIIAGAQFVLAKAMLAQERVDQAHDLAREALTAYEAHQPVRAWAVREWINQLP